MVPLMQVVAPKNTLNLDTGLLRSEDDLRYGLNEPADTLIFWSLVAVGVATSIFLLFRRSRLNWGDFLESPVARVPAVLVLSAVSFGVLILFFPLANGWQVNMPAVSVVPIGLAIATMLILRTAAPVKERGET